MANYLLSMQFDRSGCTDKTIRNLGGVSFNYTTSLGQAAYFSLHNIQAGFKIFNSQIKYTIENKSWCIYFKYKIRKEDLSSTTPIIVYYRNKEYYEFLTIENTKSFVLYIANMPYYINDIEYTFDNEWHTFYTYFDSGSIKMYIDGYAYSHYTTKNTPEFGETFYIGTDTIKSNLCGYLNDFNIFDGVIYYNNFIPPTDYIFQSDIMTNYKGYQYVTKENFEPDLINSIEHNLEHTADRLIEHQKGSTPRFLKMTWYQIKDGYFSNVEYKFNYHRDLLSGIYINITGIDTSLLTKDDKYFSYNLETALELKKIHPLVVFINKRFVRLSKIKLVRSDDWYTLFIRDIDPKTIVNSLDIILIPFNVIYEEDYGEREDLYPLYSFDKDGKFTVSAGISFYYINSKINPKIKQIGTREYEGLQEPNEFMHFIWRYGKLETRRISDTNGAFMQFISDAENHIVPGNKVILYAGTTLIDPSFYRIVGHDLIYFENIDDVALVNDKTITMQIITDNSINTDDTIMQDLTDIKIVSVVATEELQGVFKLPEVVDQYGIGYRNFLVFKGHVLMEEHERYTIDYDTNELTIINYKDYIPKGRNLTFVFIKLDKAGANGMIYTKPISYYCRPNPDDLSRVSIPIENKKYFSIELEIYTLTATTNNQNVFELPILEKYSTCIVFKGGLLFPNSEFKIHNNLLILTNDNYLNAGKSLYMVVLKNTAIKHNRYFNFLQRTILSEGNYTVIPPDWYEYEDNMMVFLGGRYLDPSLFRIENHNIYLEDETINDLSKTYTLVMIVSSILPEIGKSSFDYSEIINNFKFHYSQSLESKSLVSNGKVTFNTKFKDYALTKNNFMLFSNGLWVHPDRYEVDSNNQISFIDEYDKEHAKYSHYNMLIPNAKDSSNIEVTKSNSIIFVNDTFISPYRYTLVDNTIIMHSDFKFKENSNIIVVMLALTNNLNDSITPRGKILHNELLKGRRYILYDLGIPKNIKISTKNFICFDQNGLLINDLRGYVYNYNIIKYLETNMPLEIQPKYLTCVYNEDTLDNEPNVNRFRNEIFLREYISAREEFYEMDINFDQLMADFNFKYDQDLTYGENLSNALDYIISYNQNKIDDVYEKNRTAFIKDYNNSTFNQALVRRNDVYTLSIPRDEYDTNKSRTYPLFFVDGKLADWNIQSNANNTVISTDNRIPAEKSIKSINFRRLRNFLYPLNETLKSLNNSQKDIVGRVVTGKTFSISKEDLNKSSITAKITILEKIKKDIITCRIEVDPIIEPQWARRKFSQHLLDIHCVNSNEINKDIIGIIQVEPDRSVEIDYQDYAHRGIYYDIFMRMEIVE